MKHQTWGLGGEVVLWQHTSLSRLTAKESFSLNYVDYTNIIYRRIIAQRCLTVDR